jgi:hypothetical protein
MRNDTRDAAQPRAESFLRFLRLENENIAPVRRQPCELGHDAGQFPSQFRQISATPGRLRNWLAATVSVNVLSTELRDERAARR